VTTRLSAPTLAASAGTPPTSLLDAFLEQARRHPCRPAITAPDGEADYAALARRATALATELRARGVGRGDRVVVALPPGREAVASALAAFLLAAAYVAVDPDQPPARLRRLIEGCDPAAVLGAGPTAVDPATLGGPWPAPGGPLPVLPEPGERPGPEDVAYVVHTSGSTGAPKALQVEHRSILNLLAEVDRRASLTAGATGSWWTSPGFDVAMWECWAPLTAGGRVAVVPASRRLEADRLLSFLHESDVRSAYLPPSHLPALAAALERDRQLCARLERLLVGVEPIPLGLVQRIARSRPGLVVINGYGPAETTVCCTLHVVPATGGHPGERTPIGRPIGGNRAYLVDADGHLTSGPTGELVIVGTGVARGYLRPDGRDFGGFFTADDGSGERGYRTGDLVRLRPDGDFEFIGRVDRQLKVRGHRVEPAEVEAAIRAVATVREVVVAGRHVPGTGDALAAYLVPAHGARLDPARLRAGLAGRLPYHAVPAVVLVLDEIPQTQNGKTDHALLAALEATAAPARAPEAVTADPLASLVLQAWHDELPTSECSFVEAGGASLAAARVAALLRRTSGREISAVEVLRAASPAALTTLLRGAPPLTDLGTRGRTEAPLGLREQALWFHDRLNHGQDLYLEALCFHLPAQLAEGPRLERALRLASADHPAFGAAVEDHEDGPRLVLGRHTLVPEAVPDLVVRHGEESETLGALITGAVRLADGPLFRCLLAAHEDGGVLLVLLWHHLVVDSWSGRLFLRDLQGHFDDPDHREPRPTTAICDLVLDRDRDAHSPAATEALRAAVDRLTPALDAAPHRSTTRGDDRFGAVDITLDAVLCERLDQAARRAGTTTAAALVTAYQAALCEEFTAEAVPVAMAVDDRWLPGSEQVAGCLVDTVLLPGRRRGHDPEQDLRAGSAELAAALRPSARLPLPTLVAALRRTSGRPLFDFPACYFGFDDESRLQLAGMTCPQVDIRPNSGRFGVTLLLSRSGDHITGRLHHRYWALTPDAANSLGDRFLAHLTHLTHLAHPYRRSS